MNAPGAGCLPLVLLRFVKLECCDEQLQLVLRKIPQASLRQIGSTSLEVGIFVDQVREHLQHFSLRFRHLLRLLDRHKSAEPPVMRIRPIPPEPDCETVEVVPVRIIHNATKLIQNENRSRHIVDWILSDWALSA